jgi:hypothetical protein
VHHLGVLPLGRVRAVLLCSLYPYIKRKIILPEDELVRSKHVVDIF